MMILDSVVDYNIWLFPLHENKLIELPCRWFYCEPLFSKVKANVYAYIYIYALVCVEWAERKETLILNRNLRKKVEDALKEQMLFLL